MYTWHEFSGSVMKSRFPHYFNVVISMGLEENDSFLQEENMLVLHYVLKAAEGNSNTRDLNFLRDFSTWLVNRRQLPFEMRSKVF